jgi:pimeloyl-ACP methyl ester carboxylesterase
MRATGSWAPRRDQPPARHSPDEGDQGEGSFPGEERLARLPLGLFGASTGAAAALVAAAEVGEPVRAVVSRGGRPDLAAPRLGLVTAATLLIVGGRDLEVLEFNRRAAAELRCPHELIVVPGAGHRFEEPGALEAVARHAGDWFGRHMSATTAAGAA